MIVGSQSNRRRPVGHWVALKSTDSLATQSTASRYPGITCAVWRRQWKDLEDTTSALGAFVWNATGKTDYLAALDQAVIDGIMLHLFVEGKSFSTSSPEPNPDWVVAAGLTGIYGTRGSDPAIDMYCVKWWEPDVVTGFKVLIDNIASEFGDHPAFAGFTFQEPATGWVKETSRSDHTNKRIDMIQYACAAFPTAWVISFENVVTGTDPADISIEESLDQIADDMQGYSNYVFASPDTLPGSTTLIRDIREKGECRRILQLYPHMNIGQSMQNHDHYYKADGTGAGSKVAGYPPFKDNNSAGYHDIDESVMWGQNHMGSVMVFWNRTDSYENKYSTHDKSFIASQPRFTPARNMLQDEKSFGAGTAWDKTNITISATEYTGRDCEYVLNDSALLFEVAVDGTHTLKQVVPNADVLKGKTALFMFDLAAASDLDATKVSSGLSRRARLEVENTDGTTYAGHFHFDTQSFASVNSSTGRIFTLEAIKDGAVTHGEGFWICQLDCETGTGSGDLKVSLKVRKDFSNSYMGIDTDPALCLGRAKLIESNRP